MGSFERAGNRLMPVTRHERVQSNGNKYCVWYQNRSLGRWLVIFHTKPSVRNNLGNGGCTRESGFDPVELWVMGPPCGLKVGRWWCLTRSCKQGMSEDSLSVMSATTSVPRARDEENHFPARWTRRTNRQSSRPSVVTGMSSTIVTRSYWQSCISRHLHKQRIITAQICYVTRKVNITMERKV